MLFPQTWRVRRVPAMYMVLPSKGNNITYNYTSIMHVINTPLLKTDYNFPHSTVAPKL